MAHYSRWIEFLGGDLRQVGLIMGFGAMLSLFLRPWMAQWMNRLGSRTMWAIGYGLFAASSLSNLLLYDLSSWVYVVRSGLALGAAIVFASGLTYVAQIAPDHRRAEAIGILGVGGFAGMLIGPFLGDLFLGGGDRLRTDFVMFFVVAAIANLVPAWILWFMRPPERPATRSKVTVKEFVATVRRHWPGSILLVDFVFGAAITGPFIFVASFIDRAPLQMDGLSVLGVFFLFYAGPAILIRIFGRRLPEKLGERRVLLFGGCLMSVGIICFSFVHGGQPWMILLPAVLAGTGHSLMFHTMTALTLESFPNELRGTGSALALMMLDAGTIAGAPAFGSIGEHFGFVALFCSIGGLCLLGMLLYWIRS